MIRALNPEVGVALEHAGLRARTFLDVTTIRFPAFSRATYRIELDSGETIKARCLDDASSARRLFEIRRHIPDAFVPAFNHHGRVLLERWVHGQVLGRARPDAAQLVEAGAILASLHTTRAASQALARDDGTGIWSLKTEKGLRTLVESRALDALEAQSLSDTLVRADPGRASVGLGHFDFCGENMVIDLEGRVRVFDNERVGVGPFGFDLARTWYRWGLPARAWAAFQRSYDAGAVSDERPEHFAFWCVVVLVQSACLRLGTGRSHLSVPLGRLRRMAAEGNGGAPR